MRPPKKVNRTPMSVSTPYEPYRRRVRLMERLEALRRDTSVAKVRSPLARAVGLTPDQLINIRKGRLKDLYAGAKRKIDEAFIAIIQRQIRDFDHELAMAHAGARPVDPGAAAKAQASIDALEQLIREARENGLLPAASAAREKAGPSC